jgi:hypothetical protein
MIAIALNIAQNAVFLHLHYFVAHRFEFAVLENFDVG